MSECPIREGLKFLDEVYCPMKEGHWDCPDPCSSVPIIKLLAEAEEVTEVGRNFRDTNGGKEEGMWFWVRQERKEGEDG